MYERMGFILKAPVRFNPASITASVRFNPTLLADINTYREWWGVELTLEEAAMLLGGLKPHTREEGDDNSWVEGFERLLATLRSAVKNGQLTENVTLSQLVVWARSVGRGLPTALEDHRTKLSALTPAIAHAHNTGSRRRTATRRIEAVIETFVSTIELAARRGGEEFDRREMPGDKDELADFINAISKREDRRRNVTLHEYFERLGLRWPTYARRGGLRDLRTRLGLPTGSLGDVSCGSIAPPED